MTRKMKFDVCVLSILSLAFSGHLVCFPVFADNPVDISIVEKADDGSGGYKDWEDIIGAMPGETYSAIPRVVNNGSVDVRVRMCLSRSGQNSAGESIEVTGEHIFVNLEPGWTKEPNTECYGYDSVLAAGATTDPLFSSIIISNFIGNEHQGTTFSLHLEAFATEDLPDNPDTPVSPDNPSVPNNPNTGVATDSGLSATAIIPYILGGAAMIVLLIHILKGLFWKKNKN